MANGATGYGGGYDGIDLESRAYRAVDGPLEPGSVHGGNRPPDRRDEERSGRQGASPAADPSPLAAEARAGTSDTESGEAEGGADERPHLLVADRPSRRQELSLLRRAAGTGQAILRHPCADGLHPPEEQQRGVILSSSADEPPHQPSSAE